MSYQNKLYVLTVFFIPFLICIILYLKGVSPFGIAGKLPVVVTGISVFLAIHFLGFTLSDVDQERERRAARGEHDD